MKNPIKTLDNMSRAGLRQFCPLGKLLQYIYVPLHVILKYSWHGNQENCGFCAGLADWPFLRQISEIWPRFKLVGLKNFSW